MGYDVCVIDQFWEGSSCANPFCAGSAFYEGDVVAEDSAGYPCCDDSCALMSDVAAEPVVEV